MHTSTLGTLKTRYYTRKEVHRVVYRAESTPLENFSIKSAERWLDLSWACDSQPEVLKKELMSRDKSGQVCLLIGEAVVEVCGCDTWNTCFISIPGQNEDN